jgi:hypothetical protein
VQLKSVLIPLLLIAGCTSSPEMNAFLNPWEAERQRCVNEFGHQPGTPGYQQCVMQLEQMRFQRAQVGMGLINASQPPPPQPPLFCTSRPVGGAVNTTCY